ncbi:MAG: ElyC/SanA/YdcF family protein [Bacteroidales bacterium]|nr:ElyC/SanA/YdcF family protein [Bacteroidales bacterium]HOK98204.1 ElyC/SanA/YdcF family protein [Bacteroidales bacterium]HPO65005.1 ElyC/SanA/YdcF family protein [Bacteroidales bacterium]
MRLRNRKYWWVVLLCIVACGVGLEYMYRNTSCRTEAFIYSDLHRLPRNKVAIVLGTSKYTKNKTPNPYFYKRIAAAELLYKSGKVQYLIVSGDNLHRSYNEPMMMKRELNRRGIPDSVIFLDYAGLRTFDSVIRGYKIFGQNSYTVVSQRFQVERAVYIAHQYGIGAIGYVADEVDGPEHILMVIREYFARALMYWDILVKRQPRFLGASVEIPK